MNRATSRIEGRNPVLEAVRAGRPITRILVARGLRPGALRDLAGLALSKGIPLEEVDRSYLDGISKAGTHQGVIAFARPWTYVTVDEILVLSEAQGAPPLVVVLDGIEDPRNLGSIIRTAYAAGVHGIIIPERRASGLTPVVAKASAGAIEHMPVARVVNIPRTLEELKKLGFWVIGADVSANKVYYEADLACPVALVIGGESRGISRLTMERCDLLVRIPMKGDIGSLNASVACALLLYEVLRQREVKRG